MNLPRGQHPGAASFFELRNALADRFRLEGTAVLKVIDQPRQSEISVLTDFAVADSARKGILHRLFLLLYLFLSIEKGLRYET